MGTSGHRHCLGARGHGAMQVGQHLAIRSQPAPAPRHRAGRGCGPSRRRRPQPFAPVHAIGLAVLVEQVARARALSSGGRCSSVGGIRSPVAPSSSRRRAHLVHQPGQRLRKPDTTADSPPPRAARPRRQRPAQPRRRRVVQPRGCRDKFTWRRAVRSGPGGAPCAGKPSLLSTTRARPDRPRGQSAKQRRTPAVFSEVQHRLPSPPYTSSSGRCLMCRANTGMNCGPCAPQTAASVCPTIQSTRPGTHSCRPGRQRRASVPLAIATVRGAPPNRIRLGQRPGAAAPRTRWQAVGRFASTARRERS